MRKFIALNVAITAVVMLLYVVLDTNVRGYESEIAELKSELNKLEFENTRLQRDYDALDAAFDVVADRYKETEAELVKCSFNNERLSAKVSELEAENLSLIEEKYETILDDESYELLTHLVSAENGDDFVSAYLTACCVLNRAEQGDWGGTRIADVVYAKGQFEVVSNGRIKTAEVTGVAVAAIDAALRYNRCKDIVGFSMGDLHSSWLKMKYKCGGEYFYTYK